MTLLVLFYIFISVVVGLIVFDRDDNKLLAGFISATWPVWFGVIYLIMAFNAITDILDSVNEWWRAD